ncbi:normocyte-binding protein [Lacrimispora amygdalina]|uniref:Normocyte-binding protein n=1 Tax=Lacrimispora amygdalina TaxID=253257 RepID=A0A3E2NF58_9FIRM|nr:normocyte-binding protein [Clostridium indicum]RFZ79593.1 normocyte-binding protein [Clostridium indicum]
MSTVFLEADYLQCKQLEESKRIFHGTLSTEQGEIPATFQLSTAKRYVDNISQLYRLFCANHIPWVTVNCSYLLKFFDVYLVGIAQDSPLPENMVTKINIAYKEYEKYICLDQIPVWNIEKMLVESDDFPVPAGDKVNFEYRFDLSKVGMEHGYLVDYDSSSIVTTRQEGDFLVAVSSQEKEVQWNVTRIIQRKDTITDHYHYELLSNKQTDSFAGRMALHYGTVIRTKLELMRILNSFEAGACLEFNSLHIAKTPVLGETYDMNPFIMDEIREDGDQKTMILRFKSLGQKDFLIRDTMSFLVSQVQYIYPEYRCVGVLV